MKDNKQEFEDFVEPAFWENLPISFCFFEEIELNTFILRENKSHFFGTKYYTRVNPYKHISRVFKLEE